MLCFWIFTAKAVFKRIIFLIWPRSGPSVEREEWVTAVFRISQHQQVNWDCPQMTLKAHHDVWWSSSSRRTFWHLWNHDQILKSCVFPLRGFCNINSSTEVFIWIFKSFMWYHDFIENNCQSFKFEGRWPSLVSLTPLTHVRMEGSRH